MEKIKIMNTKQLLLIVDDEPAILQTLKESLEDESYRVKTLSDGNQVLETIGDLVPDLVLLDIFMPNCNGLELLSQIKKEYPHQMVIVMSGFGNIPIALEAVKKGAFDFIEKPFNLDEVLSKIELAKTPELQTEEKQLTTPMNDFRNFGLIGENSLFLEFIQHVQRLALLKHPLLIYGLHGTGKTLTARYVHQYATQGALPFVLFNCSTTLDTFDCDLASITAGTIFLKNINDLTELHQKELLFFLHGDEYKKRNAQGLIRIIASSYQSLFKLSLEHKFNHSLLHKLNITPIELVSLNKRRYDIPLLCNYFLAISNKQHNKNISLSTQSIRFLRNHNWIGNIAELRRFIDTVVTQAPQHTCTVDIPYLQNFLHEKNMHFIEEQTFLQFNSLQEATENFERSFLVYALKKNRFNMEHVSNKLNISLHELQDKISKLDIQFR
jgi:DNA-binding NtrC family response regulator